MKLLLIPGSLLFLSNCAAVLPEPLIVTEKEYIKQNIEIKEPPKYVDMPNVEWFVVSEKNLEEALKRIEETNGAVAFMAITPKGYENLALGIGDLRRYILQQKEIIAYYEKAVEPASEE